MPLVVAEDLAKTFTVDERRPGLRGAVAGLLRRRRREVRALDGVSFTIEPGELVAYIGPNGAGKSTTVKILSGVLVPTRGRCIIDGRVPWEERADHVARIGVVFGQRSQLWWDLPVEESFTLLRAIYRVDPAAHRTTRDELVELLELGPLLATPVRQLSLGQRMRCELVAALLHEPALLFLDEPTIGLDAPAKLAVRRFVKERCAARGTTVILTTHDLDDVEAVCERVMVIGKGRLLVDGTPDDLRQAVRRERHLTVDLEDPDARLSEEGTTLVARDGGRVTLAFDPHALPPAELIARFTARHAVRDLFLLEPPIDEVVAELYARIEKSGAP